MGRVLSLLCLGLVCSGAGVSAVDDGTVVIEGMNTSIVVLTSSTRPDYLDGKLIGLVIAKLRAASPTFRDLLAALAASPRLLTLISTSTDVKYAHGLIGRTRFQVGPDRVVAFVEIFVDRANSRIREGAIAHELGHIAEVACVGVFENQEDLRRLIRARAASAGRFDKSEALETGFAVRIGEQVLQEARSKGRLTSQFARLTAQSGLTACPATPPSDGFTIVQKETRRTGPLFQGR